MWKYSLTTTNLYDIIKTQLNTKHQHIFPFWNLTQQKPLHQDCTEIPISVPLCSGFFMIQKGGKRRVRVVQLS